MTQPTTHSFQSSSELQDHVHAPPSSPSFEMPNVFVIPPEEEQSQNPPWCYFSAMHDTQHDLSTPPNIGSLDLALTLLKGLDDTTPIFARPPKEQSRTVVMPKNAEVLRSQDHSASRNGAECVDSVVHSSESVNDSVVVEVVKINKSEGIEVNAPPTIKRTKTLKLRASQALRSLKNIGKVTGRKTSAKEIWPSNASTPSLGKQPPPSPQSPEEHPLPPLLAHSRSLSRDSALKLSELFNSLDAPSKVSGSPPLRDPRTSFSTPYSHPRPSCEERNQITGDSEMNDLTIRSPSPAPSSAKSFRQRFSVFGVGRFFSLSSQAPQCTSPPMLSSGPSSPTSCISRGVSCSSASESAPETPLDDVHQATLFPGPNKAGSAAWQSSNEDVIIDAGSPGELSFEMRLDSLHFDTLSFDPEIFSIPISLN